MTREQKETLAALLPEGRVRLGEPLSNHSSMGVGGPAEAFVTAGSVDELKCVMAWAMEMGIEYRFWGGGSKTLVRDGGVRGVTIALGAPFGAIDIDRTSNEEVFVRTGAAAAAQRFVEWTAAEGLSGAELLAGCFGTIGGNLLMNTGTAKGSIGDLVEEITVVDREGRELSLKRAALRFEEGGLKLPRTMTVIRALFKLGRADASAMQEKVAGLMAQRRKAQPMEAQSLGCIFKNPGKTPAGVLIDEAGFRGVRVGGARVSPVHANFIVNEGRATARDVIVLMNLIRERVKEQTGVALELQIEVIGDE